MWERIGAMVFKEVRQMLRDPGTIAMMFMFPIIQMVIFGFAINNDPRHLPLAIEANDSSALTRSVISSLSATGYFDVSAVVDRRGEGARLVEQGKAQFLLTIPSDFSRALVDRKSTRLNSSHIQKSRMPSSA